jgi:hypothetical protein
MTDTAAGAATPPTDPDKPPPTAAGEPPSTDPGKLGDVRNILGFLVAGFVGALNLLGLRSGEIGVVLRNDLAGATIVATFLLVGILCAMASVFVTSGGRHPVPPLLALAIGVLLASMFPLSVWIIPATFGTAQGPAHVVGNSSETSLNQVMTFIIGGISAVLFIWALALIFYQRHKGRKGTQRYADLSNLQSLLLFAAILLSSTATYGVMRLEALSQASTVAELGDTLQTGDHEDALAVSVSAVKLTTREWLGINIMAVPRRWNIKSRCLNPKVMAWIDKYQTTVPCLENPCYYFNHALSGHCRWLSSVVIPPDSSGAVNRTLNVLFSPHRFQHIYVTAVTCAPSPPIQGTASQPATGNTSASPTASPPPTTSKSSKHHRSRKPHRSPKAHTPPVQPAGTCLPTGGSSRLDISIPGPPSTRASK